MTVGSHGNEKGAFQSGQTGSLYSNQDAGIRFDDADDKDSCMGFRKGQNLRQ